MACVTRIIAVPESRSTAGLSRTFYSAEPNSKFSFRLRVSAVRLSNLNHEWRSARQKHNVRAGHYKNGIHIILLLPESDHGNRGHLDKAGWLVVNHETNFWNIQHAKESPCFLRGPLRSSNTGNMFAQLVAQHCCVASWKALFPVLPPSLSTCHATNFDVASCGNILRKVDLSFTFCNKLSILSFASQLAKLHNTCDWSIFPHQKRGKDGE